MNRALKSSGLQFPNPSAAAVQQAPLAAAA
jgi:hypothetical protein